MKRNENEVQKMFRQNARTGPQKALQARIDKLHEALDGMSYRGLPQSERQRLLQAGKQAIAADLANELAAERERITAQVEHIRGKYEADYRDNLNLHAFELAKYERRFQAMSDTELRKAANQYADDVASLPNDPGIVDALSAELHNRGFGDEHEVFRGIALQNHYDEPWMQSEQGKLLSRELALTSQSADGVVPVEIDGKPAAFSIDALTEDV